MGNPSASAPGHAFDAVQAPAVTAGAYSAGDIVGGLLSFNVGTRDPIIITGAQVILKDAITSTLVLHLFSADPAATTKTNNEAYSLHADDAFKLIASIAGFVLADQGTPNAYAIDTLNIVARPADGNLIYGLLVDGTGFTPTTTSAVQVRLRGRGA